MARRRLPVAPRPYGDELLSSWLGRVACRYGLAAEDLAGDFACGDHADFSPLPIDDFAPMPDQIRVWARACGVDPLRLRRLSLSRRHPRRPPTWFSNQAPEGAPLATLRLAVCPACLDADHAAGRDGYLRADWMLAERCICPAHGTVLLDRCPHCHRRLQVTFRLQERRARPVCGRCQKILTDRGGEGGPPQDRAFIDRALTIQRRAFEIVNEAASMRERFETVLSTLWAPLDRPGAARPVLALWFNEAGWRCSFEARHAVGASAPLGQLPIRWRVVTLIAMSDLFGVDLRVDAMPAAAVHLLRRAVPRRIRPAGPLPTVQGANPVPKRSSAEYLRLARKILAHPDWIAAGGLPERKRQRVRARLIDVALAKNSAPAIIAMARSGHSMRAGSAQ